MPRLRRWAHAGEGQRRRRVIFVETARTGGSKLRQERHRQSRQGDPSESCQEENADGKGEGAQEREQVAGDAPAQGQVSQREPMALGGHDDHGIDDKGQSKHGKRQTM